MAINFPASPTNNQTFTSGGISWVYSTAIGAWKILPNTIQGTTGVQGNQGIQGISNQGVQGIQGPQGIQGLQGTSVQGLSGTSQGIQGIQGIQGRQGTDGSQGIQGRQGIQGANGFQGIQGTSNQGIQGVQGALATATSINATAVTTDTKLYPVLVYAAGSNQTAQTVTSFTFNSTFSTFMLGSNSATSALITYNGNSASVKGMFMKNLDVGRWFVGTDAFGEGGSNTGTDFGITNYSDTGTLIGTVRPITIYRSNGAVSLGTSLTTPYIYLPAQGAGIERQIMWDFTGRDVYFYGRNDDQVIGLYDTVGGARWSSSNTGLFTVPSLSTTTGTFSGTITLPSGAGNNYIKAGTGDGASFTTYNLKINSWWGIGFGDYQDLTTVKAYLNTREGSWGLSGSLGVGTASSGTNGEIRATNNITAYYSDRRLKYNIKIIEGALSKVNQISGVTFQSNEEAAKYGYTDTKTQVGVIAQEIEAVLPEVVVPAPFDIGQNEDGTEYSKSGQNYKTVQYEKLVPLLIEAIKEMSTKIDNLEEQIETLKNK